MPDLWIRNCIGFVLIVLEYSKRQSVICDILKHKIDSRELKQ